jgi:hypothetical protein
MLLGKQPLSMLSTWSQCRGVVLTFKWLNTTFSNGVSFSVPGGVNLVLD